MRKILNTRFKYFLLAFLFSISTAVAKAESSSHHPFGLGAVIGEPTGLTMKYFLDSHGAVDGGLAYSFNSFTLIYLDYLWHFPHAFASKGAPSFFQDLTPYVGIGGAFFISTDTVRVHNVYFTSGGSSAGLGFRIPLGMEWRPGSPRIGIFAELVPGVGLIPGTFGFFEGGIGARFYF